MATKKYPVGTSIKYIGNCPRCRGYVGKVVGKATNAEKYCYIALPQSPCGTFQHNGRTLCSWEQIEPLVVKGQQLMFDFALEGI